MIKTIKSIQFLDDSKSRKIIELENDINFLKSRHQEMLLALQNEIENLKVKNIDLQRLLFLSIDNDSSKDIQQKQENITDVKSTETIDELQIKISFLQEQLRLAQDANTRLEKELNVKNRLPQTMKHKVAKSSGPVIQKAEQAKLLLTQDINCVDESPEFPRISAERRSTDVNYSNLAPMDTLHLPNINFRSESIESKLPAKNVKSQSRIPTVSSNLLTYQSEVTQENYDPRERQPYYHRPVSQCELTASAARLAPLKKPLQPKGSLEVSSLTRPFHGGIAHDHGISASSPMRPFRFDPEDRGKGSVSPRAPNGLLMRSAGGRVEQQKTTGIDQACNNGKNTAKPFISLPAIRNTFDVNKAALKRKSLELQKNHLAQCRDRYLF